jgi:hypothetical protein
MPPPGETPSPEILAAVVEHGALHRGAIYTLKAAQPGLC